MSKRELILNEMVGKKREVPEIKEQGKAAEETKYVRLKFDPEIVAPRCPVKSCNAPLKSGYAFKTGKSYDGHRQKLYACTIEHIEEYHSNECPECKSYYPYPQRWNKDGKWICSAHCFIHYTEKTRENYCQIKRFADSEKALESATNVDVKQEPKTNMVVRF